MSQIISCNASSAAQWDDYLLQHPDSNFYQLYGWKSINEKNFGHRCYFQALMDGDRISGVLPVVFMKSRLFGRILSSMPFVNFGGLCADSEPQQQLLLKEAQRLTEFCGADYMEIRSTRHYDESMPVSLNKVSMTLDLDADPDVIWNGFKSKHRTNIRRVYKDQVAVKHGRDELLDSFYQLLSRSWKNLGTPIYRKTYFQDILDTFGDKILIFIAYQGDEPIAAAFNGYYKDTVEGMWAAALPEHRSTQVNYVLYWEMIKHACEQGYKHYHLGRSTANSGAEAFKRKWNAYDKQLYWQYILHNSEDIPQLNVSNPKFDLAIKAWRKLPLKATTLLGPMIARSIP